MESPLVRKFSARKNGGSESFGSNPLQQPDRADRLSDIVALNALEQRTRDYLSGHGPLPLMSDGQVSVWVYDSADNWWVNGNSHTL